eukprot:31030-Eustigmatos_ZCMA.PRE.1
MKTSSSGLHSMARFVSIGVCPHGGVRPCLAACCGRGGWKAVLAVHDSVARGLRSCRSVPDRGGVRVRVVVRVRVCCGCGPGCEDVGGGG